MEAGRARARPSRFDPPEEARDEAEPAGTRPPAAGREDGPRPPPGSRGKRRGDPRVAATEGQRGAPPSDTRARQHGAVPPRYPPADSRAGPGGEVRTSPGPGSQTLARPLAHSRTAPPPAAAGSSSPAADLRSRPGTGRRRGSAPPPSRHRTAPPALAPHHRPAETPARRRCRPQRNAAADVLLDCRLRAASRATPRTRPSLPRADAWRQADGRGGTDAGGARGPGGEHALAPGSRVRGRPAQADRAASLRRDQTAERGGRVPLSVPAARGACTGRAGGHGGVRRPRAPTPRPLRQHARLPPGSDRAARGFNTPGSPTETPRPRSPGPMAIPTRGGRYRRPRWPEASCSPPRLANSQQRTSG
nr:PREDICTED: serine/arginine repetitive matrix protein 3-like [Struthio camelus australis]